jgi:hypothetical protein
VLTERPLVCSLPLYLFAVPAQDGLAGQFVGCPQWSVAAREGNQGRQASGWTRDVWDFFDQR